MSPAIHTCVAVDLGASSGRIMASSVSSDRLELVELHRVSNRPVRVGGTLHWDLLALYRGVLDGLREAARSGAPDSIGIDSWAVDYGLLDAKGRLLGNPVHYRDPRTDGVMDRVLANVPAQDLYSRTGVQFLPFNTIFQLVAESDGPLLDAARTLLLVPDLVGYWLTGRVGVEATNASTTQLLDVRTEDWCWDLIDRLGLPRRIFPTVRRPGEPLGSLLPEVAAETGLPVTVPVVSVGSHDTASALVGVPAVGEHFAYVSCGTWSLVGVELTSPVLSEQSRLAGFTNERGVDGTVRYLRNVMGLWLLQESLRNWQATGLLTDLDELLGMAASEPAFAAVVNPDEPEFLAPGDMPGRIADACRRTGQAVPLSPPAVVRCILESLALGHRRAIKDAVRLSGREVDVLHLVGGGARNALLCQLTADASGLPVVAGPVEAAALGNVLVQARALGAVRELGEMRRLVAATQRTDRYEPRGTVAARWDEIDARTT